jgi:hypothetical protein
MVVLLASVSCTTPAAPAQPAVSPVADSIEGDLSSRGFVESRDGRLQVSGRTSLLVGIAAMGSAPAAPPGWILLSPVFNIAARDRQNRVVVRLPDPVALRFQVPDARPGTILVHDGTQWVIVPSERDETGSLIATVEHLTPYAAARPAGSGAGSGEVATAETVRTRPPATSTQPRPAGSPLPPPTFTSRPDTPSVRPSSLPLGASSPVAASTSVSTVPLAAAETALVGAIELLKGKRVRVSAAGGYTGSFQVAVPPSLQQALSSAISGEGTAYYGLYNALNETVTVQGTGGSPGLLALLSEPRTSMPTSNTDAENQLKSLFPGVRVSLSEVSGSSNGYLFTGTDGFNAYALGFVTYEGVPLAYVLSGNGRYQGLVSRR